MTVCKDVYSKVKSLQTYCTQNTIGLY